jgi:hypothetical protein
MKVYEIPRFPPLRNIRQLSGLLGKDKFLHHFVSNYASITKVFMHLLKNDTLFICDERAQDSFHSLKKSLVSTPQLKPRDYNRYFLLYISMSERTILMVLVQEYDELHEHVIYYLRQNTIGPELKYSHVEKLSLVFVHVVKRLCHYI